MGVEKVQGQLRGAQSVEVGRAAEVRQRGEKEESSARREVSKGEAEHLLGAKPKGTSLFNDSKVIQDRAKDKVYDNWEVMQSAISKTPEYQVFAERVGESAAKRCMTFLFHYGYHSEGSMLKLIKQLNEIEISEKNLRTVIDHLGVIVKESNYIVHGRQLIEFVDNCIVACKAERIDSGACLIDMVSTLSKILRHRFFIPSFRIHSIQTIMDVSNQLISMGFRGHKVISKFLEKRITEAKDIDILAPLMINRDRRDNYEFLPTAMFLVNGLRADGHSDMECYTLLEQIFLPIARTAAPGTLESLSRRLLKTIRELSSQGIGLNDISIMLSEAFSIDPLYFEEIIAIMPDIVKHGFHDHAPELCQRVIQASGGHVTEALEMIPHMLRSDICAKGIDKSIAIDEMEVLVLIADNTPYPKVVYKHMIIMLATGITSTTLIGEYCHIATDDADGYPVKRLQAIIEADQEFRTKGITTEAERIRLIRSMTYEGDTALSTKLKSLPETTQRLLKMGWTMDEIATLLHAACVESGAGEEGGSIVERLPDAVSKMNRYVHNKKTIPAFIRSDWKKYIDVGVGQNRRNQGLSRAERSEERIAEENLNSPEFYSQFVPSKNYGEYRDVVKLLRRRGFRDSEIVDLIVTAYRNIPTGVMFGNIPEYAISNMLDKINVLNEIGIDETLSLEDYREIIVDNISTPKLEEGAKLFCREVVHFKERRRYLERLGPKGLINFFLMISNLSQTENIEREYTIDEMASLCLRLKKEKGITHWYRYSMKAIQAILNPRPGRETVFVVVAESDWNGVFDWTYFDLDGLVENGYNIVLVETGDEEDIYRALKGMPKGSIDELLIYGHGEQKSTTLEHAAEGERGKIDVGDDEWSLYRDRFDKAARVFLFSCSTGKGGESAENLGSKFNQWLGLTTYAPNVPAGSALSFDGAGKPRINFSDYYQYEVFNDYSRL